MTRQTVYDKRFIAAIIAGKSGEEAVRLAEKAQRMADRRNAQAREARRARKLGTDRPFDLANLLWGTQK